MQKKPIAENISTTDLSSFFTLPSNKTAERI